MSFFSFSMWTRGYSGKKFQELLTGTKVTLLFFLQFTLQAVLKGNKPDYHLAMGGEQSENFYQDFLQHLRSAYRADAIQGKILILILLLFQHVPLTFETNMWFVKKLWFCVSGRVKQENLVLSNN